MLLVDIVIKVVSVPFQVIASLLSFVFVHIVLVLFIAFVTGIVVAVHRHIENHRVTDRTIAILRRDLRVLEERARAHEVEREMFDIDRRAINAMIWHEQQRRLGR